MKALLVLLLCGFAEAQTPTLNTVTIPANTATSTSAAGWSTTPDYRVNVPEPTNSGDTLIAGVCYNGSPTLTVTDSAGDTATSLVASSVSANSNQCKVFSFSASAGVTWVNFHFSSTSVGFVQPYIADFYNVGVEDGSGSCNSATSGTITAGSLGTLTTGDLILQLVYSDAHTGESSFTAGSQSNIAWRIANALFGDGAALQYGVYNATTALNPQFSQGTSQAFISCAIALKAAAGGSLLSPTPYIVSETDDAMPKVAANPWSIGATVLTNVVYFAYLGNDSISSISSSPAPDVTNWTASGADFTGTNGHNHVNIYCAKFSAPPGVISISLTRSANTNDSINKVYSVAGAGGCNLDVDSAGQAGNASSVSSTLQVCGSCATPTHTNDFIIHIGGEFWCTTTTFTGGFYSQTNWFSGNTVDGPTQTDENNSFATYKNGASLSALNVTWNDVCTGSGGSGTISFWASRVAAYQSGAGHSWGGSPSFGGSNSWASVGSQQWGSPVWDF